MTDAYAIWSTKLSIFSLYSFYLFLHTVSYFVSILLQHLICSTLHPWLINIFIILWRDLKLHHHSTPLTHTLNFPSVNRQREISIESSAVAFFFFESLMFVAFMFVDNNFYLHYLLDAIYLTYFSFLCKSLGPTDVSATP